MKWRFSFRSTLTAVMATLAITVATPHALAIDPPICIGEVSPPPAHAGIDAAVLRDAANSEISLLDVARLGNKRRVIVSLALTKAVVEGPVDCTVNAMLRDAKTGAMIAIIESGAHAEGPTSAELKKQVAGAAIRGAVRRIPNALGAK